MNNYQDAKIGKRIRLLDKMVNKDSTWMPEEDLPVGLEGTIEHVSLSGSEQYQQIWVRWDNGRSLGVLPHTDKYLIIN
jgi:hypothetical protein